MRRSRNSVAPGSRERQVRAIRQVRTGRQKNYNSHQDIRDRGPRGEHTTQGTTTPVMLRFIRLRRAQGHVAFAAPRLSMASADSRRMGNDGGGVGGGFQPYLDSLRQELQQRDPTLLSVVVALLAVLLTLVIWKVIRSRRSSQRAVLLVGLCDSGKTLLFVRLLTGLYRDTQTSITDSSAAYRVNNSRGSNLTLIDLPGHESLRLQFLERFKASARAVVFVVDSAAFQREVKDVAEFLYQVLIDSMSLKNAPLFLIACNKQDITMAKSAKLIQQQLEKELNTLRVTRSAAPSTLDSSSAAPAQLGKKGKEFEFSQLPLKVEFVECSAKGGRGDASSADIQDLEKWLAKIA